jgi:hypothetical protein
MRISIHNKKLLQTGAEARRSAFLECLVLIRESLLFLSVRWFRSGPSFTVSHIDWAISENPRSVWQKRTGANWRVRSLVAEAICDISIEWSQVSKAIGNYELSHVWYEVTK